VESDSDIDDDDEDEERKSEESEVPSLDEYEGAEASTIMPNDYT